MVSHNIKINSSNNNCKMPIHTKKRIKIKLDCEFVKDLFQIILMNHITIDEIYKKVVSSKITKNNVHDTRKFSTLLREISKKYNIDK